jgi:hypothetical protein
VFQLSQFCCDNGSPDGRVVEAGWSDRMIYERHVGRFLVSPVGGVWFNLEDLHFFQHILWFSSYACWANFDFFKQTLVQVIFVLYDAYF